LPEALNLRELALLADAGLTDHDLLSALTDPWPFAQHLAGVATEVPDGPQPLLERLSAAHVVREGE
jgi:hypothetical protein